MGAPGRTGSIDPDSEYLRIRRSDGRSDLISYVMICGWRGGCHCQICGVFIEQLHVIDCYPVPDPTVISTMQASGNSTSG